MASESDNFTEETVACVSVRFIKGGVASGPVSLPYQVTERIQYILKGCGFLFFGNTHPGNSFFLAFWQQRTHRTASKLLKIFRC